MSDTWTQRCKITIFGYSRGVRAFANSCRLGERLRGLGVRWEDVSDSLEEVDETIECRLTECEDGFGVSDDETELDYAEWVLVVRDDDSDGVAES